MNVAQPLNLRMLTEAEFDLKQQVSNGRVFIIPTHNATPIGNTAANSATLIIKSTPVVPIPYHTLDRHSWHDQGDDTVVRISSSVGDCLIGNGRRLLSLLSGLPAPTRQLDDLSGLFERVSLALLENSWFAKAAPLEAVSSCDTSNMVDMTLIAEQDGIAVVSHSRAHPAFWRAILSGTAPLINEVANLHRDLCIDAPFIAGDGRVPASALADLRVGDVLQLGAMRLGVDLRGWLSLLNYRFEFAVHSSDGDDCLVIEAIYPIDSSITVVLPNTNMTTTTELENFDEDFDEDVPPGDGGNERSHGAPHSSKSGRNVLDVDNLEIEVVAALDSIRVSVGELATLQVGSVLKIGKDGVRAVSLEVASPQANGRQVIALGELVQVGDALAIEISRVFR